MDELESISVNDLIVQKRFRAYAKRAKEIINEARAENTKKAYQNDWRDFLAWCQDNHLDSLPAKPETVMYYVIGMADGGMKLSTIQRRMSSIAVAHLTAGFSSPTKDPQVLLAWDGIRRTVGWNEIAKSPILVNDLHRMIAHMDRTALSGLRDRALILLGFTGAFRRSELVAINLEDIQWSNEGIVVNLRKSKTNQEGKEEKKAIPYGKYEETCPVRSLQAWIISANLKSGALFYGIDRHGNLKSRLTGTSVALIVKKYVALIGLDPSLYSGHSLRAGFATASAQAGVEERLIMEQTGHKSVVMVRRYIREASLFDQHAMSKLDI